MDASVCGEFLDFRIAKKFPSDSLNDVLENWVTPNRVENRMLRPKESEQEEMSLAPLTPLRRVVGGSLALLARLVSGYTVRWLDCQPDTCQRVYFANHTSHLDAVVLWSALPRDLRMLTRPVAALDYWGCSPIRRYLASSFNAILIDRKEVRVHHSPVELMIREIQNTHSLIVFPEGSRNTEGEMNEFKSGLYYLAKKRPDLELVPVYMENMNRILPRGEVVPVPLLSSITIGAPIFLETGEPKHLFLTRAREAIRQLRDRENRPKRRS